MGFIQITPDELRIGLYIRLECSWWNHPFAKSKFKISSSQEIKTIKGIRKAQVFYDPDLSDPDPNEQSQPDNVDGTNTPGSPLVQDQNLQERNSEERRQEQIQACLEHTAELQKSSYLYQQVIAQTKIALKRISDGHAAGLKSADEVVASITQALSKPATSMALIDILSTSSNEDPFLAHALNVCVVSLLVGQELAIEGDVNNHVGRNSNDEKRRQLII